MHHTILVPLDGSDLAERALALAPTLAEAGGARLVLLRAVTPPAFPDRWTAAQRDGALAAAEEYLAAVAPVSAGSWTLETAARAGEPAEVITAEVRARPADLVVMSTHGRSGVGALTHGGVAGEVLRRAQAPVIAIPPNARISTRWHPGRVLVALDGSPRAERGLPPALELAKVFDAEVLLLRAIGAGPPVNVERTPDAFPDPAPSDEAAAAELYLWRMARDLGAEGWAVRTLVEAGEPGIAIADAAGAEGADLITLASRRRGGVSRLVLGSTATRVLQAATVPVLLAGAPESDDGHQT